MGATVVTGLGVGDGDGFEVVTGGWEVVEFEGDVDVKGATVVGTVSEATFGK